MYPAHHEPESLKPRTPHQYHLLQAAQVRKAAFVPEDGVRYNPDRHQSCTVYAGTTVQQVRPPPPPPPPVPPPPLLEPLPVLFVVFLFFWLPQAIINHVRKVEKSFGDVKEKAC